LLIFSRLAGVFLAARERAGWRPVGYSIDGRNGKAEADVLRRRVIWTFAGTA